LVAEISWAKNLGILALCKDPLLPETKRINKPVRNNLEKLPERSILELSSEECSVSKSKFSTSTKREKVKPPPDFPEKGLDMLATILKRKQSKQPTFMSRSQHSASF
jgi:hypothetical protein